MPPLLRALPYFDTVTVIAAAGIREQANAYQIIVWVSVTGVEDDVLPATARRFPAILDTGHNDNFTVAPLQLRAWAGLHWNSLPEERVQRYYGGIPVPTRRAYLWLHPNQYGWRDLIDPLLPPVRVEMHEGITVFGNGEQVGDDHRTTTLRAPRLPIIGLRALTGMDSQLHIDAASRSVCLDVPQPMIQGDMTPPSLNC